jgi:hypothetical protein
MKTQPDDIYVDIISTACAALIGFMFMACCAHYALRTPELKPFCEETPQPGHPYRVTPAPVAWTLSPPLAIGPVGTKCHTSHTTDTNTHTSEGTYVVPSYLNMPTRCSVDTDTSISGPLVPHSVNPPLEIESRGLE